MDFLGPIFTRVAMRDLRFLDPRDQRGTSAFGRGRGEGGEAESPEWGQVARQRVAEALARRWESRVDWWDLWKKRAKMDAGCEGWDE